MSAKISRTAECVIIGAGFAGAATAYHLSRRGFGSVVILEKERTAGQHSSGRNASMIRQIVGNEALLPLTRDGAAFIRQARDEWNLPHLFQENGSLLLGKNSAWIALESDLELARSFDIQAETWTPDRVMAEVEATEGGSFDGGIFAPRDGVVDSHALLQGYLGGARERGAHLALLKEVRGIEFVASLPGFRIETDRETIETPRLVNAAGAWSSQIAKMAGASSIRLLALRRHLIHTGPLQNIDPGWPFVWDQSEEVYFRPESGGLLLSACDEDEQAPCLPGERPEVLEMLHDKLHRAFPRLAKIPVARYWAGLRVFADDGRFVIGEDPELPGFFWATGLGGHGVTTSSAVGALTADAILQTGMGPDHPLHPSRLT